MLWVCLFDSQFQHSIGDRWGSEASFFLALGSDGPSSCSGAPGDLLSESAEADWLTLGLVDLLRNSGLGAIVGRRWTSGSMERLGSFVGIVEVSIRAAPRPPSRCFFPGGWIGSPVDAWLCSLLNHCSWG